MGAVVDVVGTVLPLQDSVRANPWLCGEDTNPPKERNQ